MQVVCSLSFGFAFTFLLCAQTVLPKDVIQLARLKRDVVASLAMLDNYTCVETIDRSDRRNAREPFHHRDTLHLEVAVAHGNELYAWPGAGQFEEGDLAGFVGGGMISTGNFETAIRSVLLNNVSEIKFHGEEEISGRNALRWDYTIPYNVSGWTVHIRGHGGLVSEAGSFWADAETLQLLRLQSSARDIPPDLFVASITNTIEYARIRMRSKDLLLPQSIELLVTDMKGAETGNRIEFSQCREFAGAANLSFDQPATTVAGMPAPAEEIEVPAGLEFSVHLAQVIDSNVAAVGDRITAVFDAPVHYHGSVLIPKGALLEGRLRRLVHFTSPHSHYLVGLEFSAIQFAGGRVRFTGEMVGISQIPGLTLNLSTSKTFTTDYGVAGSVVKSTTDSEFPVQIPGVGSFFMEGAAFRLAQGTEMTWRTSRLKK
ncbi:MAG TPA: hypothetical protein VKU01_00745 [Bryobacteraceae bacterium]|nr:hypothetical protein [Bryobacteraceae bacterium]